MHKSLVALAAAAALGLATAAAPAPANAGCYGCAVGAGIIGGVAAGAIIGSAIANSPPPPRRLIRLRQRRTIRLLPAPTLSSRPVAIGESDRFGSKGWGIAGGRCKSVSSEPAVALEFGRSA